MSESPARARVLRALTSDHHVRFSVLDAGALWDGVRRGHPHLDAVACASLVELLCAALLLQSRTFFSERLQLMFQGSGRIRTLVADSWPEGDIRGVLDVAEEKLEGPWIQAPGLFRVMRSNPKGKPYMGTLELVQGGIQTQVEAYLLQSEQTQASLSLWCDPGTGEAGALYVEPLPECPRERLEQLVLAIEGLEVVPHWERKPDFLCNWVNHGEGAEILFSTEIGYRCRCQKEALIQILQGFDRAKLDDLFSGEGPVEVRCEYCGKTYLIDRSELPDRGNGNHAES